MSQQNRQIGIEANNASYSDIYFLKESKCVSISFVPYQQCIRSGTHHVQSVHTTVLSAFHRADKRYRFLESYMYTERYCLVLNSWSGLALSLMRSVSGKDAVKAFIMAGGIVRQGKGDHVNIKMPNGQLITIPVSGDLKIGLLKSAIRKAGLDDEDFLKLLKGD